MIIARLQVSVATINDMQTKLIYAVLYATAIVSLMFGFIGLGIRFFSKPSPIVRYLSDSYYWVRSSWVELLLGGKRY